MSAVISRKEPIVKEQVLDRVSRYPRLRFMGSKFKVIPYFYDVFAKYDSERVLDAFSGSGVVGYTLKAMGKQVTSNDFLKFSSTVAKAVVENPGISLNENDIELVLSPNADDRSFIQDTFEGLYFPDEDHSFLDSAWSNIEKLPEYKKEIAISALCLAAARKQPRGVFTVTSFRYDDGRRNLRMPLRDLFVEAVREYNDVVFDNGQANKSLNKDIFDVDPSGFDLVYFDPPYVPPRDDNCYIKRYHFLEGLSVYWRNQKIMENTKTKKLEKKYTPFSYKRTITDALNNLISRYSKSTIVLSYGSNSVPSKEEMLEILRAHKSSVEVIEVPHKYSFGTHSTALRRDVSEYIFIAS